MFKNLGCEETSTEILYLSQLSVKENAPVLLLLATFIHKTQTNVAPNPICN